MGTHVSPPREIGNTRQVAVYGRARRDVKFRHPESGFYIVGMKSHGQSLTFLMQTGYEHVRSVVAALMGDLEAARRVELTNSPG